MPYTSTTTAASRVGAVTELVETILLDVDQRTILISCIRVCRLWHGLITASHPLQRHLYFLPGHASNSRASPTASAQGKAGEVVINPLLDWGFSGWFSPTHWGKPWEWFSSGRSMKYERPPLHHDSKESCPKDYGQRSLNDFFVLPWNINADAWRRKEASWRKMFITQPPVTSFEIRCIEGYRYLHHEKVGLSYPPQDGTQGAGELNMGPLYDYIHAQFRKYQPMFVTIDPFCCNFLFEMWHNDGHLGSRPGTHLQLTVFKQEGKAEDHLKSEGHDRSIAPVTESVRPPDEEWSDNRSNLDAYSKRRVLYFRHQRT
jgi:hypothetical protein